MVAWTDWVNNTANERTNAALFLPVPHFVFQCLIQPSYWPDNELRRLEAGPHRWVWRGINEYNFRVHNAITINRCSSVVLITSLHATQHFFRSWQSLNGSRNFSPFITDVHCSVHNSLSLDSIPRHPNPVNRLILHVIKIYFNIIYPALPYCDGNSCRMWRLTRSLAKTSRPLGPRCIDKYTSGKGAIRCLTFAQCETMHSINWHLIGM